MTVLFAAQRGSPEDLGGLLGWVVSVVDVLGSVGVGLLVLVETVFPPIPSEAVLPLGGYLASQGRMSAWGVVVTSTVGSVLGAGILYSLGRRLGAGRLDALLRRIPLMEQDDLDRARSWFDRHGGAAVFFGRCIPGVRSLISLPAGTERMDVPRFVLYTAGGSLLWNAGLIWAGWALGSQWTTIGAYSDYLNYAIYATVAAVLARFVWKRRDRIGWNRDATVD